MSLMLQPEDRARLSDKFPGRIPVFVLRDKRIDSTVPHLEKAKFLVPGDLRVGQFIFIIRRQMKLPPEKALFLFIGDTLPTTSSLMSEMHSLYKSSDGALRVIYMSESVFGGRIKLEGEAHELDPKEYSDPPKIIEIPSYDELRTAFYTTPEIENMWRAHYARMMRRGGEYTEVRVFDVSSDGGVYNGKILCPETPVEGGGIYKLEPDCHLAILRFQAKHKNYRVTCELNTNYVGKQHVVPATLQSGISKLRVEDIWKYDMSVW